MTTKLHDTNSSSIQLMMSQIYQQMSTADTDGTVGLSKDELSSVETCKNSNFLQKLTAEFESLDTDSNGQISKEEFLKFNPLTEFSTTGKNSKEKTLQSITTEQNVTFDSLVKSVSNSLEGLSDTFVKKLLSSYQSGDLSKLKSALNLSV